MISTNTSVVYWLKTSDQPVAKIVRSLRRAILDFEIPSLGALGKVLYAGHRSITQLFSHMTRVFYYTPLFKSRLKTDAKRLYMYGGMPAVIGSLDIEMGEDVELAARTTLAGRTLSNPKPLLKVGNQVVIGWHNKISVGTKVVLGDQTYLAGGCHLVGYPGHTLDPEPRAKRLPDTDDQCGDIILEKNVWLGSNVTVLAGVTIGENTVVGAGSVVTKDLPPNVLAAGVPAKVIKSL